MTSVRVAVVQAEPAASLDDGLAADGSPGARSRAKRRVAGRVSRNLAAGYPAWLDVCRDVALWDHEPVRRRLRDTPRKASTFPARAGISFAASRNDTASR
jgi:hypothetical protein